jgi:bifunctional non-homologous end joining protein LigD
VIVWDAGIYAPEDRDGNPCFDRARAEHLVRRGIDQGRLTVLMHGHKLRGMWSLVHTQEKDWLFLKKEDGFADAGKDVLAEDVSVLSGLRIEDLKAGRLPRRTEVLIAGPATIDGARAGTMPRMLSPMLPSLVNKAFSHPNWLFEPKLDGYRVLGIVDGDTVQLYSRRGLDCSNEYPWLVRELKAQPYRNIIVDGEIVAVDENGHPSFQLMQNRQQEPRPFLLYYAFDVLYRDGYDLRGVKLEQRKDLLERSIMPTDRLRVVETFPEHGEALFDAVQKTGLEGIVGKRRDSKYETGRRSEAWLKIKATQSDEFVVGGYTVGSGSRAATFGSLIVGQYEDGASKLTYVGHAGSGFDDKTLDSVYRKLQALKTSECPFNGEVPTVGRWMRPNRAEGPITWVRPELVAQVKYTERTSDGILRAPVFLGLREDKAAADVHAVEVVETPRAPVDVVQQLTSHTGERLKLVVDGHDIGLTNLNKEMWPAHGDQRALTKRDLLIYYARLGAALLNHTRDRPLTLVRFPNGIHGGHFYQKHYEQPLPSFVETVWLYSDHNKGDGEYLLINNLATLLWLGQVADLELHTWYSRVTPHGDGVTLPTTFAGSIENIEQSALGHPDFIVFDLDPYLYSGQEERGAEPELHQEGFAATCQMALWLKEVLDSLGLASFVKTTGKTGLHVYVPIARTLDYHATHSLSATLAQFLVQQHPKEATAEWAVDKRRGKVFVDYNQNVRGKTLASIYSPRVLPWAAVSMPIRWDEVGKIFPTDFTLLTAPARLTQVGDLWAGILDARQDVGRLLA